MRARLYATDKHRGQQRKYTGEPYIVHPFAVAAIVKSVPHSEEMIAAAWLHDVVEDCGVKGAEIWNAFGSEVCLMVMQLTKVDLSLGNRTKRMGMDCERLGNSPAGTQTVKLADLIDNSSSIMQHDPNFARKYLQEKRDLLNVLTKGDRSLWNRADEICRKAGF